MLPVSETIRTKATASNLQTISKAYVFGRLESFIYKGLKLSESTLVDTLSFGSESPDVLIRLMTILRILQVGIQGHRKISVGHQGSQLIIGRARIQNHKN